jgi:iron complex outermembrane receptor protein
MPGRRIFRAPLLLVCISLLILPVRAGADGGTLTGRIINESDGEPLFGAKIILRPADKTLKPVGATSNERGRYEIPDIPFGVYSAEISCVGFEMAEVAEIAVTDTTISELDINLVHGEVTLNTVLVSASRRPEKVLDAPASVSVIESEDIEARVSLTPAEHVMGQPAVDVATTGMSQSSVVVRGFNNVFSGALLVLTDNRIARVPSLRYNGYNFISVMDQDIERIEIVSGPGSALYGPNSESGIMHITTKSPFNSRGTTVSVGGGERSLLIGSFRHAGSFNSRIGYKVTGQYYRGEDWESSDPYEPDSIRLFRPTATGPQYVGGWRINERDYDIEKISGEARVDYIAGRDIYTVFNCGINRVKEIEITSLGAAQASDWTYLFGQARFMYKDLFVQGYVNASDAGDTYLLRTGQLIIDKSRVWSGQVQNRSEPLEKLSLTYGFDSFFTRPNTESTINGRNEDDDNVDEFGIYIQPEIQISDHLKFIGAGRVDYHSRIDDLVFSPRAALTYQPDHYQNFRLTYNRAYSTPNNTNLHLDILQAEDPFGIGSFFEPYVGFRPDIDIRVQGVPETGFHWRVNENGPQFRSPFAPLDPRGLDTDDFIDLGDPVFTNVMWNAGQEAVIDGFAEIMTGFGIPQETIDSISTSMRATVPAGITGVGNIMKIYNPDTGTFDITGIENITDIDPLKPTFTNTLEFGYKGMLSDRLRIGIDIYRTQRSNFVGPLAIETPNVFLDQESLSDFLQGEYNDILSDPSNAEHAAVLAGLDDPALGGNGNGTPVDELVNIFSYGAAGIPFGTVSPQEALDPEAVLVTFRNFGDIALYGADIALAFRLGSGWLAGGNFSYISKNLFKKSAGLLHDIYLNSPRYKFGLFAQYRNDIRGLDLNGRLRFVDDFEMYGPFIGTTVKSYMVVDLSMNKDLIYDTGIGLTVQNALDNRHREFVGAPELGRLMMIRLTKNF